RFWFRKTWTGKLVLLVEEEKPRWLSRRGPTKLHWRDARLLDLAEAPMRTLMTLERTYRAEYGAGAARVLKAVVPSGTRGAIAASPGQAASA
ncbi:MAG: hypothetical protein INR63_02405, partial [Actinomycetospora chiangmaiensis]|nr:hypothetical protein [Actinomycetospora chiangmaiensis]